MIDTSGLGPLLLIQDAARKGGIHKATIYAYIKNGYLTTHLDGAMVYYRDVLRASRIADEKHKGSSGKASKNYGKKKEL